MDQKVEDVVIRRAGGVVTMMAVLVSASVSYGGCGGMGSLGAAKPITTTTSASSTGAPATSIASSTGRHWTPAPGLTWQYQLSGRVDTTVAAQVFDIDGLDNPRSVVANLHARGRKTICYIDAGTWETWRPDARSWPRSLIGKADKGWPGENWVDIRQTSILMPLIAARLDVCRAKRFDGVEFDNVDGYQNDTGFALSRRDQLVFDRDLAAAAHALGLAAGLKNDVAQVPELVASFDFEVDEECVTYDECAALRPFVTAGKAVFHVEYQMPPARACASLGSGLSTIVKHRDLAAWREACPATPGHT